MDDLENSSRRNNIRKTGLPEKVEGMQPATFIEVFLKELFGSEAFPTPPTVYRAREVAISHKKQDVPLRPFIARVYHYQTKERIMKLAREVGPSLFGDPRKEQHTPQSSYS